MKTNNFGGFLGVWWPRAPGRDRGPRKFKRLEPGLTGPAAEALLNARGYTLGHFPQSFELATIGGFAATRSAGQASTGYGRFDKGYDTNQKVIANLPATVTMALHPGECYQFAVPEPDLKFFDRTTGLRIAPPVGNIVGA